MYLHKREKSIGFIPIWGDAGGLYGYIHPLDMEIFLNLLQNDMVNASDSDKAILLNLADDTNPVLMYYE